MSSVETEVVVKHVPPKDQPEHVQHDSHDEEYESADDAYEEGDEEEVEVEIEEEVEEEDDGDDEKLEKDKELDDDEDRKNPQFIPKKGYFYEHDDRTKTDEEGEEQEPKKEDPKKIPVTKEPNRWSHDLFDQEQQAPKSKEELSQAYGYDIWSEENAPRARRRRRYGRGPNKYTRQWEDEEAYQKPRGGFRGRGGRGRGNYRENNRRGGEEGYEEEFPELAPGSKPQVEGKSDSITERRGSGGSGGGPDNIENDPKQRQKDRNEPRQHHREGNDFRQQNRGGNDYRQQNREGNEYRQQNREGNDPRQQRRDVNEQRHHHGEVNEPRQQNRERREDYSRRNDGDNERYGPPRGGRGGGRGRGRRNEFSNRNRYPSRRDEEEISNKPGMTDPSEVRERVENRPQQRVVPAERKEREARVSNTNGHVRDVRPKESPLPSKPPFTNTEYTGSASMTAHRNISRNQNQAVPNKQFEDIDGNKALRMGGQGSGNGYAEKPRDLRDVLNARRDARMQQSNTNDRRSQIPPRLQQQQAQQQQQQQQHPGEQVSAKPKRFSTQRQRQVEQSIVNTAGPMQSGIPTSVPMTQGMPNMLPVVTGAEQMIPSPVPAYPQAPTYYDGSQVYETAGSPVTVVTVANGTSVSPSLWTPHAYANAPYPSPPTGPQVPQPPYADHPAYIAAQPTGPIYSGPPPFIQDPTMMNYQPTAPPFGPPYHPQGFQGYPQVAPPPPPEVYHAGVTYYSPQTQIHRQPMMAPQKRPKSVLQLVEPPGKAKADRSGKEIVHHEYQPLAAEGQGEPEPISDSRASPVTPIEQSQTEQELVQQLQSVNLEQPIPEPNEQKRKPSPLPPQESWSAQMEEFNSPIESPETSFKKVSDPDLRPSSSTVQEKPPTDLAVSSKVNEELKKDSVEKAAEQVKPPIDPEVEIKNPEENKIDGISAEGSEEIVKSQPEPNDEEKAEVK